MSIVKSKNTLEQLAMFKFLSYSKIHIVKRLSSRNESLSTFEFAIRLECLIEIVNNHEIEFNNKSKDNSILSRSRDKSSFLSLRDFARHSFLVSKTSKTLNFVAIQFLD